MKLYIADRKGYSRKKLLRFWDSLGTIPRFASIKESDFVRRPPKTKAKKRKREPTPFPEDAHERVEFDLSAMFGAQGDHGDESVTID